MTLHVHRTGSAFLEALRTSSGAYFAICDRSGTSTALLRETEAICAERDHRDVRSNPSLSARAEALLREYFVEAARLDSDAVYAYSSRVLLAIPDYPDIALVFMLRALRSLQPRTTAHVLAEDAWKAQLVHADEHRTTEALFRPTRARGLARALRSLARRIVCPRAPAVCDVVIFTLGDATGRGEPDSYFGELAQSLSRRARVLTVYAAPGKRLRLPASRSAVPIECFLRLIDPLRAWLDSRRAANPKPQEPLTAYLQAREHQAGEVTMLRVLDRGFARMLGKLKPHTLIYPFENRTWEKNLLRAARAQGVRCCVGYQHSSITPRHLAFSSAAGLTGLSDLPDAIVTCGEVTAELIAERIPQTRALIRIGAALRARRLDIPSEPGGALLAAISSSRSEAWEILRLLHATGTQCSMPIIVRTHPTIPIDDLYAAFTWPSQVLLSQGRSLATDLAACSFVAYSSSTVALEGMLYGRLPVYLDIADVPSGDPLAGDHAFLERVSTAAELAATLSRMTSLADEALTELRGAARSYAERYLIEPTTANTESMTSAILAC